MTAIILGWDPDRWNRWNYAAVVEQVAETGQFIASWNVGGHQDIPSGADAWLVVEGRTGNGLLGHGVIISEQPYAAPHFAEPGKSSMYVGVAFDALLPLGEQLPLGIPKDSLPAEPWDGVYGSGLTIGPSNEAKVRDVWREFGPAPVSDSTQPVPGTFPEESMSRVEVNRYERSPEARRACIAHRGTSCDACGFSFEIVYGEIGKDFIHVHHVVPVSQLGSDYQLDPITDLVPLCANCHAMAHQGVSTPRTVAELRRIIAGAGFLSGETLKPGQLDAQRDAQRILGQQ
ncbi:HNH endonuclease [Pseudarthrobacter sp. N5]|uniref:HNH endonuclease n=1 Tax=Pseudarthrobacter sp. N5 TaxID=3418416 RepID=UPI003CF50281